MDFQRNTCFTFVCFVAYVELMNDSHSTPPRRPICVKSIIFLGKSAFLTNIFIRKIECVDVMMGMNF